MNISFLLSPVPTPTSTPETTGSTRQKPSPTDPQIHRLPAGCHRPNSDNTHKTTGCATQESETSGMADGVPAGLARVVVNMQQHFVEELETVSAQVGRVTSELQEARAESAELRRLLDIQVEILNAVVDLITEDRYGPVGDSVALPDLAVKQAVGTEQAVGSEYQGPTAQGNQPLPGSPTPGAPKRVEALPSVHSKSDEPSEQDFSPARVSPTAQARSRTATKRKKDSSVPPAAPPSTRITRGASLKASKRSKRTPPSSPNQTPQETSPSSISEGSPQEDLDDDSADDEYRHKTRQSLSRSVAGYMGTDEYTTEETTARPQTMSPQTTGWKAVNIMEPPEQGEASREQSPSDGADSQSDFDSDVAGEEYATDSPSHSSTPAPSLPTPSAAPSAHPVDASALPDLPPPGRAARYSGPRRTAARYASGPPGRPLRYHRMGRSVAGVWTEWKHGAHGNPPVGALEARYGTGWRAGTLQERKYGSNWVAVRKIVVEYVEAMCADGGLASAEAVRRLDDRVDGRMQELIKVLRAKKDPFEAIKERGQG